MAGYKINDNNGKLEINIVDENNRILIEERLHLSNSKDNERFLTISKDNILYIDLNTSGRKFKSPVNTGGAILFFISLVFYIVFLVVGIVIYDAVLIITSFLIILPILIGLVMWLYRKKIKDMIFEICLTDQTIIYQRFLVGDRPDDIARLKQFISDYRNN